MKCSVPKCKIVEHAMTVVGAFLFVGLDIRIITVYPHIAHDEPHDQEEIKKEDENIAHTVCIDILFVYVIFVALERPPEAHGPQVTKEQKRSKDQQVYWNFWLNLAFLEVNGSLID